MGNATQKLHDEIHYIKAFMQKARENPYGWDELDDIDLIKHVGKLRDDLMDARRGVISAKKDLKKAKRRNRRASSENADQAEDHLVDSATDLEQAKKEAEEARRLLNEMADYLKAK